MVNPHWSIVRHDHHDQWISDHWSISASSSFILFYLLYVFYFRLAIRYYITVIYIYMQTIHLQYIIYDICVTMKNASILPIMYELGPERMGRSAPGPWSFHVVCSRKNGSPSIFPWICLIHHAPHAPHAKWIQMVKSHNVFTRWIPIFGPSQLWCLRCGASLRENGSRKLAFKSRARAALKGELGT